MEVTVRKAKRFLKTHADEMGIYGEMIEDVAIVKDGKIICWESDIRQLLNSTIAELIDITPLQNILEQCRQVG